jgi:hypothetical protein
MIKCISKRFVYNQGDVFISLYGEEYDNLAAFEMNLMRLKDIFPLPEDGLKEGRDWELV